MFNGIYADWVFRNAFMNNKVSGSVLFVSLLALVFFGFGCNPFQKAEDKINDKISEKVTEGILGKATGGKVDVDKDGEEVRFKDNQTGNEVAYGEDLKVPDNFPKSVPLYPDAKIKGIMISGSEDKNATLTMGTEDELAKVLAWYEDKMSDGDWQQDQSWSFDGMETRSYSKGEEKIALSISVQEDEGMKTAVILGYTLEVEEEVTE